jgi:tetratricopeptide (TPR) repeat protein
MVPTNQQKNITTNLMKKCIIMPGILLLTIFSFSITRAQDFNETIKFADIQFAQANYQLAVKEYQRALFFGNGDSSNYLYKQIANAFFKNRKFEQANYFYDLSYKTEKNDSIKKELIFNKSQCYLLSGDFKKSIYELTGLGENLTEYFKNKQSFYFGVSYFGSQDFKNSEFYFTQLVEDKPEAKNEIQKLFKSKKKLYRPNPRTAKTMSIILPGSGQIYSGDIKNGLNSLLLTSGLAILGVHVYNQYSLFDALMGVFPSFLRYYKGGYTKAYEIAKNKRALRRNSTYKQILHIIEETDQTK